MMIHTAFSDTPATRVIVVDHLSGDDEIEFVASVTMMVIDSNDFESRTVVSVVDVVRVIEVY